MSVLTSAPFMLPQDRLIQARVKASNSLGDGAYSTVNTAGILAMVLPHKPPLAPSRKTSTTTSQLVVEYPNLSGDYTGGNQIVSLQL